MLLGVETVLWSRVTKKSGNWYRGLADATNRFRTRWHSGEAENSWLRHAAVDAKKSSNKGKWGGRGKGSY